MKLLKGKDLGIGFLSQDFTLDESKSIYDNILGGAVYELSLLSEYEDTPFDSPLKHTPRGKNLRLDSWNLDKRIGILIKRLMLLHQTFMLRTCLVVKREELLYAVH